jgi:hypothetical protein
MGAVATGAFAIGVLTIGRLLIRGVWIEKARFRTLEIEELTVKRLNSGDVDVTGSLKLPEIKDRAIPGQPVAPR